MRFSLPSLSVILESIKFTILRFPLAMLAALMGTVLGIVLVHIDDPSFYPNLLMTITLSFPLFIGIVLLGERNAWQFRQKIIANGGAILFLVGYYFWLPDKVLEAEEIFIFRYILWAIGFALFITFASFIKKGEAGDINTFWQYNRRLFFSLALTVLWAIAIQVGLSIALASTDFLFDLDIDEERYMELWIFIVGIFSTLFFLSRIPKDVESLKNIDDYPKELRLFSQFVFVPLVTLYFLILYAYVLRILISWEWPKGVLAYMILGFSMLGVATYVALYPLRETTAWIKKAGTVFYVVLIPQIGMLFWALWFRLKEYGFTEKRYFVLVFGLWLLFIAIYFLASKKKDIRLIPITIFFIVLVSSFGPWGAFATSKKSQSNRLEHFLVKNNLLVNGKVEKTDRKLDFKDRKEISATIRYLIQTHGPESVQSWFRESIKELAKKKNTDNPKRLYNVYTLPQNVVEELMGIDYVEEWETSLQDSREIDAHFNLTSDWDGYERLVKISDYDYMILLDDIESVNVETEKGKVTFKFDYDKGLIIVENAGNLIGKVNIEDLVRDLLKVGDQYDIDGDKMSADLSNEDLSLKILFDNISGEKKNDNEYKITLMRARVLFSLK